MSAWIVHRRHIDFLVACFVAADGLVDIRETGGLDALGQELWLECHDSINARYREQQECPEYHYTPVSLPDLATIPGLRYAINAVGSYGYQSSEHAAWEGSRAKAWTDALGATLDEALEARAGGRDFNGINGWTVSANYDPQHAFADTPIPDDWS